MTWPHSPQGTDAPTDAAPASPLCDYGSKVSPCRAAATKESRDLFFCTEHAKLMLPTLRKFGWKMRPLRRRTSTLSAQTTSKPTQSPQRSSTSRRTFESLAAAECPSP
jgi:hypothetical protein